MQSVSILVSNWNSFEAIQLCIESIIKRTDYPDYKIIVHDDESNNGVDIPYLEDAEQKGWIKFIRGDRTRWGKEESRVGHPAPYWHGCALNVLINETCQTDLAMIMDCDAYVIKPQWLSRLTSEIDDKTILISNEGNPFRAGSRIYVTGWYWLGFALLNMKLYKNDMQVDFRAKSADLRDEPYKTIFTKIAPEQPEWGDDNNHVAMDPGGVLWVKIKLDNPNGYKTKEIPKDVERTYKHFWQTTVRGDGIHQPEVFNPIKERLDELRCTG